MSNNFTIKQVIDIVDKTIEIENKFDCSKVDLMHTIIVQNEKINKAIEILNLPIFEYDNCPDSCINEIIKLKEVLGDKE